MGRASTCFSVLETCRSEVAKVKEPGSSTIWNALNEFGKAWKTSTSNKDLPNGFRLEILCREPGEYKFELYAALDWRVAFILLDGADEAFWIDAWKKTGRRNRQAVNRACDRAKRFWRGWKGARTDE